MVGVSAENHAAAGVAAGDQVEVTIELDTEPREVLVPDVLGIQGAKTAETRRRRIDKAIERLAERRVQR